MIPLIDKPNVDPADSDYPYGNIRNNPGNRTGTPVNKLVYADMHQFFERLMDQAGIAPNGLPDNAYSGFQLFDALRAYIKILNGGVITMPPIATPWNMDTTLQINVPHGLSDITKIRGLKIMIKTNANDGMYEVGKVPTLDGLGETMEAWAIVNSANIQVVRRDGGIFDGPLFNASTCWVTISIIE